MTSFMRCMIAVVFALLASQAHAQYYAGPGTVFVCKSSSYQQNYCAADTRGGVMMTRQISHSACVQGQSWGYDRRGVWVTQGCEAEFMLGQPVAARVVRCESHDYQQNYCQVNTHGGVRLNRQISSSACQRGRTWGFDRGGIWVSDGCSGDFAVGSGWDPGLPPPPPSDYVRPSIVRCESYGNRQTQCGVDARGGVHLQTQLSPAPCLQSQTWGYNRNGIWVSNNCRADFTVGGYYR